MFSCMNDIFVGQKIANRNVLGNFLFLTTFCPKLDVPEIEMFWETSCS